MDNAQDRNLKGRTSHGVRHAILVARSTPRGDDHPFRKHPELTAQFSGDKHWTKRHPEKIARGENGTAKITEIVAYEIKNRPQSESDVAIASSLGVSYKIVTDIRSGKSWVHVQGPIRKRA